MPSAQAALIQSEEVKAALIEVLADVIVAVAAANGIPIPRPLVRAAVARVVEEVADFDPDDVVWGALGLLRHTELARDVKRRLGERTVTVRCPADRTKVLVPGDDGAYACPSCGSTVEVENGTAEHDDIEPTEVECPKTGNTITLEFGDGTYECPDCGLAIEVEYGEPQHAEVAEVICPESENTITLGDDGTYKCPDCSKEISVEDGIATHAYLVECPVSGETLWVGPDEDTYVCRECKGEIWVEDGEAVHAYAEARCPESKGSIPLVDGDGTYDCPDCGEVIVVKNGNAWHR